MRRSNSVAVLVVSLFSGPAFAQSYPADAVILLPEVEVRSGPSKNFFATSKMRQGDKVNVVRESKESPGWLEIAPPSHSFSWINAKHVRQIDATRAVVEGDPAKPSPILPGSRIVDQMPNRVSMTLAPGTIVVLVDRPLTVQGESFLPITTQPSEVRYIPAEAVKTATVVGTQTSAPNWTLMPNGYTTNSVLAEAEKARVAGDYGRARQLYQQVKDTAADQGQKIYASDWLAKLPVTNYTPAIPTSSTKPDETRTAFSPANPAVNLQQLKKADWSAYGRLYETKLSGDMGQPLYELDLGNGQKVYISTAPGKSLQSYVGRTISVFGPTMYRADSAVRFPFVVATHVAVP